MPKSSTARVPASRVPSAPAPAPARPVRKAPAAPAAERRTAARVHDPSGHRNEVLLAGRVTAEPAVRELPSGDHLITWRISITRPTAEQRPNQPADPITCVSFQAIMEEVTRGWRIGDTVQISGSLRRRFWRSPSGSSSVIEVEVRAAQRLADADPPPGAPAGPPQPAAPPDGPGPTDHQPS
ncbi:single-stranded DNA-binding protein [Murinocardiopsis flavida]|uniref:Single-stranded DNA-binding protein n=1 Tax=Murinocardiopsis flavida TaxID=645275 RepID=A0A2P8D3D4_9ACTN|nr:single-stranded DNA-binding protein [Murinocardiopsis flavida]PSK91737.1 single-stranded DNA-binding protein [Murinocardiopsis flavida]